MSQTTQPLAPTTSTSLSARPWYVCLTKPRQENIALQNLLDQGYDTYLPQLQQWVRQGGQWGPRQSVMFPRYVFVRPGCAGQAVGPVRSTPGVSTLVSFGHILACMREERLIALRELVAARSAAAPQQPFLAGTAVVFCAGPLKGASGIVSGVAAERVQVLMNLLGQDHKLLVSTRDLALV